MNKKYSFMKFVHRITSNFSSSKTITPNREGITQGLARKPMKHSPRKPKHFAGLWELVKSSRKLHNQSMYHALPYCAQLIGEQ